MPADVAAVNDSTSPSWTFTDVYDDAADEGLDLLAGAGLGGDPLGHGEQVGALVVGRLEGG